MNESFKDIKVTIGITCFNAENTISRAIYGAIKQDYAKKEIIIVDDGSTDSSEQIIKKFLNNNKIKYIKNKTNRGTSYSRNTIIRNASGEVICFMDDDDFSESTRVSKQIKALKKGNYPKNKLVACSTSMKREYNNGYKRYLLSMGTKGRLPKSNELADYLLFYEKKKNVDYGFGMPTASMLITKECFENVGFFDESLERVEDMDLSIRLSLANISFVSVKEVLVIQTSNLNKKKGSKNFISEKKLIKKYKSYLERKNLYWHTQQWPKLRYFYFQRKFFYALFILFKLITKDPIRTLFHFIHTAKQRFILDVSLFIQKIFNKIVNRSK